MARRTLIDFFEDVASTPGEFLDLRRRLSHVVVHATARSPPRRARSRRGSQRAGIGRGHAVAIWGENRPEWIIAFWGCVLERRVLVPIDYRTSGDFLSRVADIVDARVLLARRHRRTAATVDLGPAGVAALRAAPPPMLRPRTKRRRRS